MSLRLLALSITFTHWEGLGGYLTVQLLVGLGLAKYNISIYVNYSKQFLKVHNGWSRAINSLGKTLKSRLT